jgi:hypothetical protein
MKYKEQLEKVRQMGISIIDLEVANECECVFDFDYTEEEFEKLCGLAVELYLKSSEITACSIAYTLKELIVNERHTIEDILDFNKWELIEMASYYM